MRHIHHGKWLRYTPERLPEHAPPLTMFARRESDGVDWYEYINPHLEPLTSKLRDQPAKSNFAKDSVKFAAFMTDLPDGTQRYVVGPAVHDENRIWPAGHIVVEIPDYAGSDPQEELRNKVYDPDTETFTDQPPRAGGNFLQDLSDLMTRFERLEKRLTEKGIL